MTMRTLMLNRNFLSLMTRKFSTKRNVLTLRENSLFQDVFPDNARKEISDVLQSEPQCVYAGFDPTADSLHVGNLLILINLLHWQRAGHKTVALIGGATAQIGDPSGRSTDRSELVEKHALSNTAGLQRNMETIFKNHEELIWRKQEGRTESLAPVLVVNNLSWYKKLDLISFMSCVGRHFRVGTMLSRHSVQTRMASENGISFTEFSYQLFQAYDWLHLMKNFGCRFQIGGNDQMGNIVSGHFLISRTENAKVYGLTLPLVTTESGDKFGKSAGNAIWLNAEKSSPFELYQFFIRVPDSAVNTLLNLFTFLHDEELQDIKEKHLVNPESRSAQKILAEQVTLLVHGEGGLKSAQLASEALYHRNLHALAQMSANEVMRLFTGASTHELHVQPGASVMQVAMEVPCFSTIQDAKRIIKAGGFSINQQKIDNPDQVFSTADHVLPNSISLLRVGKKNYYIVKHLSSP